MKRLLLATAIALTSVTAQATPAENDYLVVVGSYSTYDKDEAKAHSILIAMEMDRCGYTVRHLLSEDIQGPRPMTPDRIVQFVGPYSREGAKAALRKIKPCKPDSYIKEVYSPFRK